MIPNQSDTPQYNRKSIRLKGYDYSGGGRYFVTICTENRVCLFGKIIGGEMGMNDTGKMANEYLHEIPKHFPHAILREHIIMPNHIHMIIELQNVGAKNFSPMQNMSIPNVGANNHSPNNHSPAQNHGDSPALQNHGDNNGAKIFSPLPEIIGDNNRANIYSPLRTAFKSPSKTIGSIVRGYKIGVTKWVRNNMQIQTIWQRNYYEHIIRDEKSYQNIANYINNNPKNWKEDKFYTM